MHKTQNFSAIEAQLEDICGLISLVLEVRLARLSQARTAEICEGRLALNWPIFGKIGGQG